MACSVTGVRHFLIDAAKLLTAAAVVMVLSVFVGGYAASTFTDYFNIEAADETEVPAEDVQTVEMRIMNVIGVDDSVADALMKEAPIQWSSILSASTENGYVERKAEKKGEHFYVADGVCEDGTATSRFVLREGYGKVTVGNSICDDEGNVYGVNRTRSGGYIKTVYYYSGQNGTYATSKFPSLFNEVPEPVWHNAAEG